jgi:DNA-binding CsgD family transcriptional regulator
LFSPEVASLLKLATDDLARYRGNRFEQFDCVRHTMSQITKVDAFYVAEFVGEEAVHYHHQYDEDTFDLPGSAAIVPGRTAYWVRLHRRTYRYAEDNGAALHAGLAFGQMDKVSRDALVSPVFDDTNDRAIMGLISIQAYTADTYDATAIAALEYLADALGAQLAHEERSAERSRRLGDETVGATELRTAEDLLGELIVSLSDLHAKFGLAITAVGTSNAGETERLRALRREVERLQSELWARELRYQQMVATRLASLTPRQRELAQLLGGLPGTTGSGPNTAELAEHMGVSEVTVKSHMNAVLRVFGAADRADVRAAMQRLTTLRAHHSR